MFFAGQIVLGLAIVRAIDGGWMFHDMRLIFLGGLLLYGVTLPLGALAGRMDASESLTTSVLMYALAALAFNAVQCIMRTRMKDVGFEEIAPTEPTDAAILILIGTVAAVFAFALSKGMSLTAFFDRTRIALVYSQLWIVLAFAVNGAAIFAVSRFRYFNTGRRAIVVMVLAIYVMFHLSLGNRRDFMPLMLFAAAMYSSVHARRITARFMLAGLVLFVAFLGIGIGRALVSNPLLGIQDPLTVLFLHNEFSYPIQTLMFYVTSHVPHLWGASYVQWPELFIPRSIWPGKPTSLSLDFLQAAFGTTDFQGYAYTPVTEAYVNFGYAGPFAVFGVMSAFMAWMIRKAPRTPVYYFVVFSLMIDFHRGEMASTIYAVILLMAVYTAVDFIASKPRKAAGAA
jgi:hypothetical protein